MTAATKLPPERRSRLYVLAALLAWCAFLLIARALWVGRSSHGFLAWNLILASVPAFASTMLGRAARAGARNGIQASWFVLWLLFLPNAPYIVTDLVHLEPWPTVPYWFDIAMYTSCAGTGLLLGWASTSEVQRIVRAHYSNRAAWALALLAQILSGFGIYLGRFMRWNSWDVISNPSQLASDLAARLQSPGGHLQPIAVTFVYGIALALGYLALRVVAHHEGE